MKFSMEFAKTCHLSKAVTHCFAQSFDHLLICVKLRHVTEYSEKKNLVQYLVTFSITIGLKEEQEKQLEDQKQSKM